MPDKHVADAPTIVFVNNPDYNYINRVLLDIWARQNGYRIVEEHDNRNGIQ
ncbi:hypothetical protein [Anaerotruncus colihominis]|uniref:hypothetical protein n=1 Tax=Anaerotruncus colihominis TaxID=169435 RepID=UPI002047546B|nr:hypothetical protein [Anaerotruncus colihominis]DAV16867.1 MAG TPA: hypothetical protein [Caudoviricetes sp.]